MRAFAWGWFLVAVCLAPCPVRAAGGLSLAGFLQEVRTKNDAVRSVELARDAAKQRSAEGELLTAYNLVAEAKHYDDLRRQSNPLFQGTRTLFDSVSLGVAKQTDFGMQAKLSYNVTYTRLFGTSPAFVPEPKFLEARPILELSQSFLKNGFGSETRAQAQLIQSGAMAAHYDNSYRAKALLAAAEAAYWKLAVARETIEIQQGTVERAVKIREWNARRAQLQLADRSDLLQAEAGLEARRLELQLAKDDAQAAARNFNSLRGSDSAEVPEELEPVEADRILALVPPDKKGTRDDVRAAEQRRTQAAALADTASEKFKPSLDAQAQLMLNGRDPDLGSTVGQSFGTQYPTVGLGLTFRMPLDGGILSADQAAYAREKQAAELQYQRARFDEAHDWKEINTQLGDARRRLQMAIQLAKAQETKLLYERERLRRGRSVTYQVLLFEQDYANAELARLGAELTILNLIAQLKTFGES